MSLIVDNVSSVDRDEWRDAVLASDDTWLFHTADWICGTADILGVENRFFLARQDGRLVGAFPVQLVRGYKYDQPCHTLYSIRMGALGPFVIGRVDGKTRRQVLSAMTDAITQWSLDNAVAQWQCSLPSLAENILSNVGGINPLVWQGWSDVSTHTLIADLSRSREQLLSKMSYDARRSARQAEMGGYSVERAHWPDVLDDYYRVHEETYIRTGVKPHRKAYFELIAHEIARQGQAVLWMARDPAGNPVAFHNDARFKDGSQYWTGCCETTHLKSGVNYLLFREAILGAQSDGCRWYEIGEIFPGTKNAKLQGLSTFKSKFGGEIRRMFRGEMTLMDIPRPSTSARIRRELRRALKRVFPTTSLG